MQFKDKLVKILFFILMFFSVDIYSQEVSIIWSKEIKSNKKTNDYFFNNFIGENADNVYAVYTQYPYRYDNSEIRMYGKTSMTELGKLKLFQEEKDKEIVYEKALVNNDYVYTIGTKNVGKKRSKSKEWVITCYDKKLVQKISSKSIITESNVNVFINLKEKDQIILLEDKTNDEGNILKLKYFIYNDKLNQIDSNSCEINNIEKHNSSTYALGADGRIHIHTKTGKRENNMGFPLDWQPNFYDIYSIVNLKNNKVNTFKFQFESKKIIDFGSIISENETKFYGLYSDIKLDKTGEMIHGVLLHTLDTKSLTDNIQYNLKSFNLQQQNQILELLGGSIKPDLFKIEDVAVINENIVLLCSVLSYKNQLIAKSTYENNDVKRQQNMQSGKSDYKTMYSVEKQSTLCDFVAIDISKTGNINRISRGDRPNLTIKEFEGTHKIRTIGSANNNVFFFYDDKAGDSHFTYGAFDYVSGKFITEKYRTEMPKGLEFKNSNIIRKGDNYYVYSEFSESGGSYPYPATYYLGKIIKP